MDPDLQALVNAELERLKTGVARAESTAHTYAEHLAAWWGPYARANGLPQYDATEDVHPLSVPQIARFVLACAAGDIRRGTRDGARAAERVGAPLSVPSFEGVLAALRAVHLDAGLVWHGDDTHVRELVAGYRTVHGARAVQAAPMSLDHVARMFATYSLEPAGDPWVRDARARAVAVALGLSIRALAALDPTQVTWSPARVNVKFGDEDRSAPCLRTVIDDTITASACGHCTLGSWLTDPAPEPLVDVRDIVRIRAQWALAARRLARANFTGDRLHVEDGDSWTRLALGLTPDAARWLRMRAALLPMRAVGLRLDDIDDLTCTDVHFRDDTATLSIVGKGETSARPYTVVLTSTGDPLCPVEAMASYDRWVRTYLPTRRFFMVPTRGKGALRHPVEVPHGPGRALYQAVRTWLVEQDITLDENGAGLRETLTPHSARRAFAQQAKAEGHREDAIQKALRHKRPGTTTPYLQDNADDSAAAQVLQALANQDDDDRA